MIPEIGHFSLILALVIAAAQAILPLQGVRRGEPGWMAVARPAARAQLLFVAIAYGCLTWAFVGHDFSVLYVASNSNSALPLGYRISAVWGSHEGSLLLWTLVLALWTAAVSVFSRSVPEPMVARVLAVMGMVSVGFLLFMLLTSNPFERILPAPVDGRDLNPLLQDPGMAIHPPMLYMGYVGFSVAFAFAIAAMMSGRLDAAWARWTRPWTNVAWMFLTFGIAIGSWWAYYELGWGGWWFWDPVENASFMPWLVGTALVHSLAATEKRNVFKAWTVLLAIFAFSLSLLGTFLVRSGVLTSVHAFATDPARGVFILVFLALVIGGSLLLYAVRAPLLRSSGGFTLVSRESALLLNNVLLVVAALSVLLGTLYPLLLDALGVGKISVGPPYFNSVFVPLMAPVLVAVGIGAMLRWRRDRLGRLGRPLLTALGLSLAVGVLLPFTGVAAGQGWSAGAAAGVAAGTWVILSTLAGAWERTRSGRDPAALRTAPRSWWGMVLAHAGVGVFTIGVTLTSAYSIERDVRLAPGESLAVAGYELEFVEVVDRRGPNYDARRGRFTVHRDGREVTVLYPEKRFYRVQQQPMTEAAIDARPSRDLYLSLGEPLDDGAWSVRVHYKPFIRWIWLGALIMGIGGVIAASDRRYRNLARAASGMPAAAARPV